MNSRPARVAAAYLQHPVTWLQAVADQVVELQLADLEPGLMRKAADRGLGAAGGVRLHHAPVVADVVCRLQAE